jgi:hypothetical protein
LPESKRFALRPALAEQSLAHKPDKKPSAFETAIDHSDRMPTALPLPNSPEPLVLQSAPAPVEVPESGHPLPRARALVAPSTGLVSRIVNWLSGSTRRLWYGAPSAVHSRDGARTDRPDVALMRAELRELRVELEIARRIADRRKLRAKLLAREDAT